MTLPYLLLAFALASPEAEIRAVLDRQQADWNRGDVVAFMTGYDDAPATTFQGKTLTHGYQQVLDSYRKRYPTREIMGTLQFSEVEVRMLSPEAALVTGKFALDRTAEAGGPASGRYTLIFVRKPSGWKIIHDHTS